MAFFYKRSTDIYISTAPNASANATNTVQLTVKDFSYNIDTNIERVGRETLDPTEERIINPHVQTVSPVSFSLTTYILPYVDTNVTSPEEYLWGGLLGGVGLISSGPTSSQIDFANGNLGTLPELTIWFHDDQTTYNYRLDQAIVDRATINFDINGIAEIQWQGRALSMAQDDSAPLHEDRINKLSYLKNKLSTITLNANATSYSLALTGGNIEINNNNTIYGRTKLGEVTVPIGHYTGNRTITGTLNFYRKSSGSNPSALLFTNLLNNITSTTYETDFDASITINIGGTTSPEYVTINVPRAIMEVPRQQFGDVATIALNFIAQEGTGNYSTVTYNIP